MSSLVVLAKEPVAGRTKTRLCPPLTLDDAARVAEAALQTTLAVVAAAGAASHHVLALDGRPGGWCPPGFIIIRQRGRTHDQRIANAFADVTTPALLIGMDSPQVTAELLDDGLARLAEPATDAVLGLAADGGWWGLGLRRADARTVVGVPMSTPSTGEMQRQRLLELGLCVEMLPVLRDVDDIHDARAVADQIPGTPFAEVMALVDPSPIG